MFCRPSPGASSAAALTGHISCPPGGPPRFQNLIPLPSLVPLGTVLVRACLSLVSECSLGFFPNSADVFSLMKEDDCILPPGCQQTDGFLALQFTQGFPIWTHQGPMAWITAQHRGGRAPRWLGLWWLCKAFSFSPGLGHHQPWMLRAK